MSKDIDPLRVRRAVERGREIMAKAADYKRRDEQIRHGQKQTSPVKAPAKRRAVELASLILFGS
jgi:hypothetical protein